MEVKQPHFEKVTATFKILPESEARARLILMEEFGSKKADVFTVKWSKKYRSLRSDDVAYLILEVSAIQCFVGWLEFVLTHHGLVHFELDAQPELVTPSAQSVRGCGYA